MFGKWDRTPETAVNVMEHVLLGRKEAS